MTTCIYLSKDLGSDSQAGSGLAGKVNSHGYGFYANGGRANELVWGHLWQSKDCYTQRVGQDAGPVCGWADACQKGMRLSLYMHYPDLDAVLVSSQISKPQT